jgi:hypothetical protein
VNDLLKGIRIQLPGSDTYLIGKLSSGQADVFQKRASFSTEYCAKKGWDLSKLTVDQLMEIRSQDGWKNPQ